MPGRIKGITVVIGGDTTGLDQALRSVNSGISKTQSALRDVQRLLKLDPSNVTLLAQKESLLKDAIEKTRQKLETLKDAQAQAQKQMESGNLGRDKFEALQREVISTEQQLSRLTSQVEKEETAFDRLARSGEGFTSIGSSISELGKSLSPIAESVGEIGEKAMDSWHEMDDAYDSITSSTGAAGEQAQELSDTFRKVFSTMPQGPEETSAAIAGVSKSLGLTGDDLATASEQFLKFAEVNNTDVSSAVESVSRAMNDAGIQGSDTSRVLDSLTAASQSSGIGVDQLADSLSRNGVTMRQLGMSTTDTIALLATMTKSGVDANTVLTGMKYATKVYGKANEDASRQIRQLFDNIKNGSASAADAQTAFGTRAGQEIYEYVKEGKLNYQDLADTISKTTDTVSKTFEATEDPIDKMEVAENNLKLAGASLGDSINTVLAPVFMAAAQAAQKLAAFLDAMPAPLKNAAVSVGLLATALGPGTIAVGGFISKIGESVKSISNFGSKMLEMKGALTSAMGSLQSLPSVFSLITSPAGIITAALAALAAVFVTLWTNDKQFRSGIIQTWTQIKSTVSGFISDLQQRLEQFSGSFGQLAGRLSAVWKAFCEALSPVIQAQFSAIAIVLKGALDMLTGLLDIFIGLFSGNWKQLWKGVQEVASGYWNALKNLFKTFVDMIRQVLSAAVSPIESIWKNLWQSVRSSTQSAWTSIRSAVSGVLNTIKTSISGSMSSISRTLSSGWSRIQQTSGQTMESMRGRIGQSWQSICSTAETSIERLRTSISEGFSSAASSASAVFGSLENTVSSIWSGIEDSIQNAVSFVQDGIQSIENLFSGADFQLPYIALPHFDIEGSFSLNPPSVPYLDVEWYAKGGILTRPTVFGMTGSSLMAGGEAGNEAVLPLDGFYKELERILDTRSDTSRMEALLTVIAENAGKGIYLDTGTLVGALLPDIDAGLGKTQKLQRRLSI